MQSKPPLIAALLCAGLFIVVRLYSDISCNGQFAYGVKCHERDGITTCFGCIDDLNTTLGVALNALSLALPICAVAFFLLYLKRRKE